MECHKSYNDKLNALLTSSSQCSIAITFTCVSCTRLQILLNTICRKPGFNSLRTPLNHGAEQASNETLKQTQQRN